MYKRDRSVNIKKASLIPGTDLNHPIDYTKSPEIKANMPSGYRAGEEMHHIIPADLFGAFVQNLDDRESRIVINRANSLGMRVGNDSANFVGLDKLKEHIINDEYSDTIHSRLDDMGLESAHLEGDERKQYFELRDKISSLPLQTRLEILPDFVTYIAEPVMEMTKDFRPNINTVKENKKLYAKELKNERIKEIKDHNIEIGAEALGTEYLSTVSSKNAKEVGKALKHIRNGLSDLDTML